MSINSLIATAVVVVAAPFLASCGSEQTVSKEDAAACEKFEAQFIVTVERLLSDWAVAMEITSDGKLQPKANVVPSLQGLLTNTNSEISELLPTLKEDKTVAEFTELQSSYAAAIPAFSGYGVIDQDTEKVMQAMKRTADFYKFCRYSWDYTPWEW